MDEAIYLAIISELDTPNPSDPSARTQKIFSLIDAYEAAPGETAYNTVNKLQEVLSDLKTNKHDFFRCLALLREIADTNLIAVAIAANKSK